MNPRIKRLLIIAGFISSVALIATLIVLVLFRTPSVMPETPDTTPDTSDSPIGNLPSPGTATPGTGGDEGGGGGQGTLPPSEVAQGGETFTTQLTTGAITAAQTSGNNVMYYDASDGRLYTIDKQGNAQALSNTQFLNAQQVSISPNGESAALEFPDGNNILYNLTTESQVTLPNHWEDFAFSNDSKSIATKSIGLDVSNRSLVVTSSDGSQTRVLSALGENANRVYLNWSPNGEIIGFADTSNSIQSGFGRKQVFLIGNDGQERGALTVEGGNFRAIWAPNSANILYSVTNIADDNRPALWYTNAGGRPGTTRKRFNIATWAEKCTFANNETLYCAVPRELPPESGYDHSLVTAPDDVYAIDIASGRSTLLAIPVLDLQMENLSISADQTTLFFTDQFDRLNSIRLR